MTALPSAFILPPSSFLKSRLEEREQVVLPDGDALSEDEVAGRDVRGVAGRRERRIDDRLLPLAGIFNRLADRPGCLRRRVVLGVHAERGDFDLRGCRRQLAAEHGAALPFERAAGLLD